MEGAVDFVVRDLWTAWGGYDLCVTEFIRVTSRLLPPRVFHRYTPELSQGGHTLAGVPVHVQLLGGDPRCLAENAALAVELGAPGIDLNFGCPAPTVNRHDGGATLLQFPERIFAIVQAVRQAVPGEIPVSAKIRLGFNDTTLCLENALAVASGGADHLTVHCRTKKDFYRPPADWTWARRIQEQIPIPVVANGEIWTPADLERCREITGVHAFMLGRGSLANPWLAAEIKGRAPAEWKDIAPLLPAFYRRNEEWRGARYAVARTKQWLRYLSRSFPPARRCFEFLKVLDAKAPFKEMLDQFLDESLLSDSPNFSSSPGDSKACRGVDSLPLF